MAREWKKKQREDAAAGVHRLKRLSMNASAVQPLWRNRHVDVTDRLVKKKFMLQKKVAALVVEMDVILRS